MDYIKQLLAAFQKLKGKPTPPETEIERALKNLRLLIYSASENAISISDEHLLTVMECKKLISEGSIPPAKEANFWIAYRSIAEEVHPITISSILATYDPHQGETGFIRRIINPSAAPLSRRCAAQYKLISVATLILLIAVQVYWYIGYTLTNDISAQNRQLSDLQTQLYQVQIELENSDASRVDPRYQRLSELQIGIQEHSDWKDAAVNHLQNWNTVWSSMDLLTLQPWQIETYSSFPTEVQRRIQFVAAGNILQAISGYILPILYGLIGACFYILRQLPKEIEDLTFSMNSYIGYSLRMAQGPLAGIIISYFFTSEQNVTPNANSAFQFHNVDSNLSALGPLALCFLAGYSIEFLFKFLDRILIAATPLPISKPAKHPNNDTYIAENKRQNHKRSPPTDS